MRIARPLAATSLALLLAASPARAEVQDCMEIASLPATISTQGVYCLKHDVSTNIASGVAIDVVTNNVTIDCNGYKIGGLAAGAATRAFGIDVDGRSNVVVRGCVVRGFYTGLRFNTGSGHVAEDNRFEANTFMAIASFSTAGDILRRNHVVDTGGNLPVAVYPAGVAIGIAAQATDGLLVDDNNVTNTFATSGADTFAYGIAVYDGTGVIRDNAVQNVLSSPGRYGYGILTSGTSVVRDNSLIGAGGTGYGVYAFSDSYCADNHVIGFITSSIHQCTDGGGNTP